ncbi:LAQU0S10e02696g1_1 [Lachancea quebecensis]|uniref:LAQU0S10e02696g1_1 n=1 Tax=Lachancea quebecensis TaxID=1654605 RepID=A0A0P1KU32_9SACH|nr:LAQU0S10e02696g1_1 [Lachancea quebecensis]
MLSQGSIPEVREDDIGSAIDERRAKLPQFQDLGPPDLVSIVKYTPSGSASSHNNKRSSMQLEPSVSSSAGGGGGGGSAAAGDLHANDKHKGEVGTFLYCVGADTSDPTSIAVFLKNMADAIAEKPQVWFGRHKPYRVARVTFATWNAFRQCDVEVVVHIPGAVQSYFLDTRGEVLTVAAEERELVWAETFASGVVRAIAMMADNREDGEVNNVVETRILNPLVSGEIGDVADHFIDVFPLLYARGVALGAPCDVACASRTNNYLCETLLHVTRLTRNFRRCRAMLEALQRDHPEVVVLLARVLLDADLEVDAVRLVHDDLSAHGGLVTAHRSELLCVQAAFLLDAKHDYAAAQRLAQAAVDCAPSEFRPWHLLVQSYVCLNDIENALLALNGCPVAPNRDRYIFKRVVSVAQDSANLHLPLPMDVVLDEVTGLNSRDIINEHKSVSPALLNLPAATLKANARTRYHLLTEIARKTGWESLLRYRSKLFVMEEEYQVASTPPTEEGDPLKPDGIRTKRLCERWLDNLFMVLYEDLKAYTLWQAEQLHFEAQNTHYSKTTTEWELLGLCALRLGHREEAATAFEAGLQHRFSAESSRKLLQIYLHERSRLKKDSDLSSSQVTAAVLDYDNKIIDLCVKICCWNHRWYSEFSVLLLDSLSVVVDDMGITKLSNEISSRFPETVVQLANDNLLAFYADFTDDGYDK